MRKGKLELFLVGPAYLSITRTRRDSWMISNRQVLDVTKSVRNYEQMSGLGRSPLWIGSRRLRHHLAAHTTSIQYPSSKNFSLSQTTNFGVILSADTLRTISILSTFLSHSHSSKRKRQSPSDLLSSLESLKSGTESSNITHRKPSYPKQPALFIFRKIDSLASSPKDSFRIPTKPAHRASALTTTKSS